MADNITVSNGGLANFQVSSDETPSGQVQRNKLTYSADGNDTPIPADANGLTVQVAKMPGSTTGAHSAVTVGATATLILSALSTRKAANFRPTDGTIYLGYSNTVTAATGFPLHQDEIWEERDFEGAMYAITASGSVNVRAFDVQ